MTRSADGRFELFALSNDGHLWHRWQDAVGPAEPWPEWENEGNAGVGFLDHPVVGPNADGRLELFLAGSDGNIWHKWQTVASNGWSAWASADSAGGGFSYAPGLGRSGDGRLELFAVGNDGNLWHKYQTAASNGWSGWSSLGQP